MSGRGSFAQRPVAAASIKESLKPVIDSSKIQRTTAMGTPVILITGALTGIGRATALAFAKEGATVVAAGRREAEGKALEAELRGLGAQAAFIQTDVRREDDVRHLVDQTVAHFG